MAKQLLKPATISNTKPDDKNQRLNDGNELYFAHQADRREILANGIDPSDSRKEIKAAKQIESESQKRIDAGLPVLNSFEHVVRDWLESLSYTVTDKTYQKKLRHLELEHLSIS